MLEKGLPPAALFVGLYKCLSMTIKSDGFQHWLRIKLNGGPPTRNKNEDKINLLGTFLDFGYVSTQKDDMDCKDRTPETVTCRSVLTAILS